MSNADRLTRVQKQLGVSSYGVYLGVYTAPWREEDFANRVIIPWLGLGLNKPDYVMVKCGEWGIEWYNGTFPTIRQRFLSNGIGCAPYYFCRPNTWQQDAAICAKLAQEAGIVILDCEEQWIGYSAQLEALVKAVRDGAGPDPVIIVSGYGDPITAVPAWDFGCLQYADAYQPQWYIGYWNYPARGGYRGAIQWGDGQIAQKFTAAGLGLDYPIQPAVNVENVALGDITPMAQYLVDGWKASVAVWVQQDMQTAQYQAFRAGVHANTPTPQPTPTPAPQPPPPTQHRTYIVQKGDTLSAIAQKYQMSLGMIEHYNPQIANYNLIFPGEIIYLS